MYRDSSHPHQQNPSRPTIPRSNNKPDHINIQNEYSNDRYRNKQAFTVGRRNDEKKDIEREVRELEELVNDKYTILAGQKSINRELSKSIEQTGVSFHQMQRRIVDYHKENDAMETVARERIRAITSVSDRVDDLRNKLMRLGGVC